MVYLVHLYNAKEDIFTFQRFLYYTKKEIRRKIKEDFPGYEIISIEKLNGFY